MYKKGKFDPENNPVFADYISGLAHEVRNPLANINLSVEMLESVLDKDKEEWTIYTDIIRRNAARINGLMLELLRHRQPEESNAAECSVYELLEEVIDMAKDRAALKKIAVSKDYAQDCIVSWDKSGMKLALSNIVINAIESMEPSLGKLSFSTKSLKDKYIIQIKDNGCGITTANLKNIFSDYYTAKPDGLGMGLSLTSHILKRNQVHLQVKSEPEKGSSFILWFYQNNHGSFQQQPG